MSPFAQFKTVFSVENDMLPVAKLKNAFQINPLIPKLLKSLNFT